ncbi:MAG TPA: glycoside hydrolase domain-containing protein [Sporichthya sp.]|nr:glycoside hydrolase domain-containing protein [Sporichthya sp.]
MPGHQRVVRSAAATRRDRTVTVLAAILLAAMALAAVVVGPSAEADQDHSATARAMSTDVAAPTDGPAYPAATGATRYRGLAFDTCSAPPRGAMQAWRSSPYAAVGIYLSGRNRACTQPELTAAWVKDVTEMGWKLLPVNLGSQAPCRDNKRKVPMKAKTAAATGTAEAAVAVLAAKNLGLLPGTPIYADVEPYNSGRATCVRAVAMYLSAWTRELHRQGYLSGLYGTLGSGLTDATTRYASTAYARPDAVWFARWDRSPSLKGWVNVPDNRWSQWQRVKQYRGDHRETHGGVPMLIDSDSVDAPVATVARSYPVTSAATLNFRRSPRSSADAVGSAEPGTEVAVVCQVTGTEEAGSTVWNKLADGSYVSDAYVGAGGRKPLPACRYPVPVLTAGGAFTHTGPSATEPTAAKVPLGALAWLQCTDSSGTWVQLPGGLYLSRTDLASFSAPLQNC